MTISNLQPMETAPKTGECILIIFDGEHTFLAYWDEYYVNGGVGYTGGDGWVISCTSEELYTHYTSDDMQWASIEIEAKP